MNLIIRLKIVLWKKNMYFFINSIRIKKFPDENLLTKTW